MGRVNPELERLRLENQRLRREIDRIRSNSEDLPFAACGNSCFVAAAEGMATNSICQCGERKLRVAVMWYRRKVWFLRDSLKLATRGVSWNDVCGYCKGYPDQEPLSSSCPECWGRK